MAQYLDPKNDTVFKKVFGEHEDILTSFLNSVLPLPDDSGIESLEYLDATERDCIVKVRCTDKKGKTFITVIQLYRTKDFKKSALYNTCVAYSRQEPVYSLNLVNEIAYPDYPDDFYHIFSLTHTKNIECKESGVQMVVIELPKFDSHFATDRKLMSQWLRFLTEIDENTSEISPELTEDICISKAVSLIRQ